MRFWAGFLKYFTFFAIAFFPGVCYGQIIGYWCTFKDKVIWTWYEIGILLTIGFLHVYRRNIIVSLLLFIGLNFGYACSILPNHDTWEVMSNNDSKVKDWGEMQVRNSGNFSCYAWCNMFHELFGGINYQIEHHLFPSISHSHLPKISPIVRKACVEFGIPYHEHDSLLAAFSSTMTNFFRETDEWDRDIKEDERPH
jgi:fatty acid desaturase